MFDFLKDLYLEANGLDMDQVKKERREKFELEKEATIILRPKTKKYIFLAGSIFIVIHVLGIIMANASHDVGSVIKSAVMIVLAGLAMICSLIKSKISEIICVVICILVILLSLAIPIF